MTAHPPAGPAASGSRDAALEWRPTTRDALMLNAAGFGLFVVGLVGYGTLAAARYGDGTMLIGLGEVLAGVAVTLLAGAALVALHEAVHALVMLPFGARPTFGAGVAGGSLPYVSTTAAGHRFTRAAYLAVALAPTLVVNALTAALVWWAPLGGWLVVAAAFHLAGCIGDWWLAALVVRQPRGSRIEDLAEGLRVHPPQAG